MEDKKWVVNHTRVLSITPVYTYPCISLPRNAAHGHADKLVPEIAAELSNMDSSVT